MYVVTITDAVSERSYSFADKSDRTIHEMLAAVLDQHAVTVGFHVDGATITYAGREA